MNDVEKLQEVLSFISAIADVSENQFGRLLSKEMTRDKKSFGR